MLVKMARAFRSYREGELVDVGEEMAATWVELCVAVYAEPEDSAVPETARASEPDSDGEELNGRLSEALGAAGARIAELEGLLKEAAAEVERLTARAENEALAAAESDGASASEATEEPSSRDPAATAEPAKATKKGK
jgi:hypothetical protein